MRSSPSRILPLEAEPVSGPLSVGPLSLARGLFSLPSIYFTPSSSRQISVFFSFGGNNLSLTLKRAAQRVPRQDCAFDAGRKFRDAGKNSQFSEPAGVRLQVLSGNQIMEAFEHGLGFSPRLAFQGLRQERRRCGG